MVEKLLPDLGMEASFLERELFVGFSGWEKRRLELLQVALLDPAYILLDEIDSGLDIDALSLLSAKIRKWKDDAKTIIIITHNFHLLDAVDVDRIIIMKDWQIDRYGEIDLVEDIRKYGFK
jgi:Fe-S cluster assembly ATP-binding protein